MLKQVEADANLTKPDANGNVDFIVGGGSGTVKVQLGSSTAASATFGQSYATKGYVDTQITNLVNGAPSALDTIKELADAINDDANFATTVTNSIATKLPKAGGTMTGAINMGANKITNAADPTAAPAPAPAAAAPAPAPATGQVPSPVAEAKEEVEEGVSTEEMAEALVAINEENESLKKQLAEALSTVKYMRGVLSETNLLNAKLLYTNKLFKGKSLTEDQKLKIINTFDLTKNIREVKLAYTVLAESFNSGASVVKKKTNTTAQTITEGLASKPVSSTKPEATIVEPQADVMASRFQKLAGIKK